MSRWINRLANAVDSSMPRGTKRLLKGVAPGIDRWFYWALWRYSAAAPVDVTIRDGPLKGRRFRCSLKTERDYWIGNHEPDVARMIGRLLGEGDVFYDVGVHKGYFSLLAAQCVGPRGRVIGFEPNPHNWNEAQGNLDRNPDLAPRVRLENLAVSDGTGIVEFAGPPGSAMGKIREGDAAASPHAIDVRAVSLDDFITSGNPPPDLIKMDIEGGERRALRGIGEALRRGAVLIAEVHDEESAVVFSQVLRDAGYDCRSLDHGARTFGAPSDYRGREQFIAFPKGHPVLEAALSTGGAQA